MTPKELRAYVIDSAVETVVDCYGVKTSRVRAYADEAADHVFGAKLTPDTMMWVRDQLIAQMENRLLKDGFITQEQFVAGGDFFNEEDSDA